MPPVSRIKFWRSDPNGVVSGSPEHHLPVFRTFLKLPAGSLLPARPESGPWTFVLRFRDMVPQQDGLRDCVAKKKDFSSIYGTHPTSSGRQLARKIQRQARGHKLLTYGASLPLLFHACRAVEPSDIYHFVFPWMGLPPYSSRPLASGVRQLFLESDAS